MRSKAIPFRVRGHEVTRLEAFSDVVFGFALTLIVVSLEVPTTVAELMKMMRGFPAFAICFAMLTWVWYIHHMFFRRYALTDEITIALNTVLLFLVLFYTYPLKFIFLVVTRQIRTETSSAPLMVIYGLGFAGIFALYVAMHWHAWRQREELELNELERWDTHTSMIMYGSYAAIGVLSAVVGWRYGGWGGPVYWLIGPVSWQIGARRGAGRRKLEMATT
jgi:uncharacterized membrane protein